MPCHAFARIVCDNAKASPAKREYCADVAVPREDVRFISGLLRLHMCVRQYEQLLECMSLERYIECAPHGAVRSIASNYPIDPTPFGVTIGMTQLDSSLLGVLGECEQFDTTLNNDTELAETITEYALGLGLREHEDIWICAIEIVEAQSDDALSVGVDVDGMHGMTGCNEVVGQLHERQQLQGSRLNHNCL